MSNRNPVGAAPQIGGVVPLASRSLVRFLGLSIMELLRAATRRFAAWRKYRREREELHAFLASDYRIAADIGYRHHRD